MRHSRWLIAACLAVTGVSGVEAGAPEISPAGPPELSPGTNYVRVSGRRVGVDGSEALRLDVEFKAGSDLLVYDGLLVYAEPSHTLLLAQSNTASWRSERQTRLTRAALLPVKATSGTTGWVATFHMGGSGPARTGESWWRFSRERRATVSRRRS